MPEYLLINIGEKIIIIIMVVATGIRVLASAVHQHLLYCFM
jgi:hypothetical protein